MTHVKLLRAVAPDASTGAGFEGRLFAAGARVPLDVLGDNPVLLEHAGPQGAFQRGKNREHLWILWRYDQAEGDWREIARAQSYDWTWAYVLRGPALRALHPAPVAPVDAVARGREVAEALLERIDTALVAESPAVRLAVLTALYDRVAGRIVAA